MNGPARRGEADSHHQNPYYRLNLKTLSQASGGNQDLRSLQGDATDLQSQWSTPALLPNIRAVEHLAIPSPGIHFSHANPERTLLRARNRAAEVADFNFARIKTSARRSHILGRLAGQRNHAYDVPMAAQKGGVNDSRHRSPPPVDTPGPHGELVLLSPETANPPS